MPSFLLHFWFRTVQDVFNNTYDVWTFCKYAAIYVLEPNCGGIVDCTGVSGAPGQIDLFGLDNALNIIVVKESKYIVNCNINSDDGDQYDMWYWCALLKYHTKIKWEMVQS